MGISKRLVAGSLFVFLYCPAKVALSEPADFSIPSELGYLLETNQASAGASQQPLVIYIQESHVNYEGQKHLAGILERLINEQGLKLILVEGGQGDVSLRYLRGYGPPENRKEVAETYLTSGLISGEEYLDIVSDYPLTIWGVERKDLHERHVEAFLKAQAFREPIKPILASVREAVDALAPKMLDPALMALDAQAQAFRREELSLGDYVTALVDTSARHQVSLEPFPAVRALFSALTLERQLQSDQVSPEQHALIRQLSPRIGRPALEALVASAEGVKAGTISRAAFYRQLGRLAADAGISLDAYPHLSRYMRSVQHASEVSTPSLAHELKAMAGQLRQALAVTAESQALITIMEQVDLLKRLVDLQLSPDEEAQARALPIDTLGATWTRILNERLSAHGLPPRSFEGVDQLPAAFAALRQFYEVAVAREEAIIDNTLAKLQQSQERVAVLITGGFHTPRITQRLREGGLRVAVMVPRISQPTDDQLYQAVLKYKHGRGSREDVTAASRVTRTR